ncbi:response regulator transcription factor [Paenibacillus sp. UMB4589-SE434]|uniref:response regulator transcription factor n=1 Tax=Paenibacillus sp. UMB4589-SE434 TaxID=3046314 RepID=UPI00254F50EF|nr:response regulator transcription factor [Paenibacillus sp. UMB4589-SE434]MDK8180908.1 response regulator transcription factor [Paenibacillus sp. UMB4589-SE434]
MAQARILIIEDDIKISRVMKLELEYEGYFTESAATGLRGLIACTEQPWDLILLDVMLPELSGLEVLRRLRANDNMTPVILLTARDSIHDKVSGLDLGANDYVTKPFQIEELLARIRALLRMRLQLVTDYTANNEVTDKIQVADLSVNEKSRQVVRGGVAIELTPREYDLLVFLMRHTNQVLNREQLLTNVWGYDYLGDTNVVDVYIRYLRKKVDHPFPAPLLHTVRGVGYVLRE